MSEKFARFTPYLDCITCKRIDDSMKEAIKDSNVLSQCRTQDAIHMGTAVFYQSYLPEAVSPRRSRRARRRCFPPTPPNHREHAHPESAQHGRGQKLPFHAPPIYASSVPDLVR